MSGRKGYKAVLFSPDGDWVVDHRYQTVEQVLEAVDNQGSRWIFYPFPVVIRDRSQLTTHRQRIVSAPGLSWFVGKSINTLSRHLQEHGWEYLHD